MIERTKGMCKHDAPLVIPRFHVPILCDDSRGTVLQLEASNSSQMFEKRAGGGEIGKKGERNQFYGPLDVIGARVTFSYWLGQSRSPTWIEVPPVDARPLRKGGKP